MNYRINNVIYNGYMKAEGKEHHESIHPIGIDTEAYKNGKCFMICTSVGDIWTPEQLPGVLFSRAGRDCTYVAYNLKYDESAILQSLPHECLCELRETGKVTFLEYTYRFIAYKFMSIRKSNHSVTFYDIYGYFGGSLEYNSEKYLARKKIDVGSKQFSVERVKAEWNSIAAYCIEDAKLVAELAGKLISVFESYGVYPRKLFSTAYVSYQYFKAKCFYVTVKRYWDNHKQVLDYAMQAYNGGKFEVTKKGRGYFYEYDIVSAYPAEISSLINIRYARVIYSSQYRTDAVYGFIRCRMAISKDTHSPVAVKVGELCVFPCGVHTKVITKNEYDYLVSQGCDLSIIDAVWLVVDTIDYPYRQAIEHLVAEKKKYSNDKSSLHYHTVKILMNSLYGKFVQLIRKNGRLYASTCWNPIYGSIITANTRIAVTRMQQQYSDIVAVHTDSVISTSPITEGIGTNLGEFKYECEGDGIIIGCGVYQIGNTSKIRGFNTRKPLMEYCEYDGDTLNIKQNHVISWKEAALHGIGEKNINEFVEIEKGLHVRLDRKRIWLNDFESFREVLHRQVSSLPIDASLLSVVRGR